MVRVWHRPDHLETFGRFKTLPIQALEVTVHLVLLSEVKLCLVPDLLGVPRVPRHRCGFLNTALCTRVTKQCLVKEIFHCLSFGGEGSPLSDWAIRLRDLEGLLRLSHHYIAPLEVREARDQFLVGVAGGRGAVPTQAVARVLRVRLNEYIFDIDGCVGGLVTAAGYGRMLLHIDVWLVALPPYFATVLPIVHDFPH